MPANLTYYIFEGVLTGTANGHMINLTALSGGGGGSREHGGNSDTNNPYSQGLKTKDGKAHVHGGPLPVGRYKVLPPSRNPHLGLSARLDPYDEAQTRSMFGRDGFLSAAGRRGDRESAPSISPSPCTCLRRGRATRSSPQTPRQTIPPPRCPCRDTAPGTALFRWCWP